MRLPIRTLDSGLCLRAGHIHNWYKSRGAVGDGRGLSAPEKALAARPAAAQAPNSECKLPSSIRSDIAPAIAPSAAPDDRLVARHQRPAVRSESRADQWPWDCDDAARTTN